MASASFSRWPWWRRWFGARSERAAAAFLRRAGHRVLARNAASGGNELDLITLHAGVLVFVEVRSTERDSFEMVAASIDARKQERLTRAALAFLAARKLLNRPARFDVLLVSWPHGAARPRFQHHANAFEAVGRFQMFS